MSENTSYALPFKAAESTQQKSHHFGNSSPAVLNKAEQKLLLPLLLSWQRVQHDTPTLP